MSQIIRTLLRRLTPPDDPSSDAAVLLRFVRQHDETAFELLVWRHGGLVMGVCRRMLRDDHLAEDAFQATFLILARKAGSVRGSLAGWLHQVARRVCLKARKRNSVPAEPGSERGVFDPDPLLPAELRSALDEEIARLPEKQRLVVLLCYLQGRTTDDVAKFLGMPQGTVLSRLDAARKRLRTALTRRGVTVPAALFATALGTPDVTAEVCQKATAAAIDFLNSAAVISVPSQLAHEVTQMTARKTALGMVAAVVMVSGVGTGVGLVMAQGGKAPQTKAADKPPAEPTKAEPKPTDADLEAKLRARRLDEMLRYQLQISKQIEGREEHRLRLYADSGGEVDPTALQARLGQIDQEILNYEDQIAAKPDMIKEVEKWIANMKAGQYNQRPNANDIERLIQIDKQVKSLAEMYELRRKEVSNLESKFAPGSPKLDKAEADLQAARDDWQKAGEVARAGIVAKIQEAEMATAVADLTKLRDSQKSLVTELKSLRGRRVELVVRIQRAKAALNAQQLIDDEIQVLREIRKQVLRERLLMEMGLENKPR